MEGCLFCQIISGELPSYKVFEDKKFFALLDIRPVSKGHILLIPKKHHRWVYDVPEFGAYWESAKKTTQVILKKLSPQWIQYVTHGAVPHAHIHIIPRYDDVQTAPTSLDWENTLSFTKEEFTELVHLLKH